LGLSGAICTEATVLVRADVADAALAGREEAAMAAGIAPHPASGKSLEELPLAGLQDLGLGTLRIPPQQRIQSLQLVRDSIPLARRGLALPLASGPLAVIVPAPPAYGFEG
jgi:hypothetical protein